jgi:diaminohydroxyphosphoribosylaminopyrimidine deaminase/5-amino-6-(5-phosphoribosylamino)uracil reductase
MDNNIRYMQLAMQEAEKARGKCSPNPFVGAVIVKNNHVFAKGHTMEYGGDHAEVQALKQAGAKAAGADMYVTLEPCSHYGKTPPCALAIVDSGIKRVFVGIVDPNPLVAGKGIQLLKDAGIEVNLGLLADKVTKQLEYFLTFITQGRPFVILKTALSLDGKFAATDGSSRWISNEKSRRYTHKLRSTIDVILTGISTIITDNPMLNARTSAKANQPLRTVLDPNLDFPLDSAFAMSMNKYPSLILCSEKLSNSPKAEIIRKLGASVFGLPLYGGIFKTADVLQYLGSLDKYSLLLESGSGVAESFLREKMVDKCLFIYAPKLIGGTNSPLPNLGLQSIGDAVSLDNIEVKRFDDNVMISGYPQYSS